MKNKQGPRTLVLDIETSPIISSVWSLWDQNIGLAQIERDWFILAFSAKWLGDPKSKVIYMDQRNAKNIEDDSKLLKTIWKLMDEADVILGQNSKRFDVKKLNARFIINDMKPPSSFKQLDTRQLAAKHFGFTSNKLEYLTDKLCTKYKKSGHKKFPGMSLWTECLKGNKQAWEEMRKYNILDVLSTEELYEKLRAWDSTINPNVYLDEDSPLICHCGGEDFAKNGYAYTAQGKFQRYVCTDCGSETRDKFNLLSKEKRETLKLRVAR